MSLRVTFLGTSGAVPTTGRNTSALAVRREGDAFLWDCGEGTQRQMMRFGTGFDVEGIFVTHAHGDHTLGLPGLLQTLDFNERERGLTIHVPGGTRRQIRSVVDAGGTNPSFPVRIDEVTDGSVAHRGDDYEIRAFETDHDARSVGYALVEDDRKGRFDRQKAEEELGIPPGPAYSRLHEGESVELDDGRVIHPEQVVGDPRPGRAVVYTGDTRPTDRTVAIAEGADLLVHDATFADDLAERARQTAHATAREAGDVASRAEAVRLALMHVSTRYAGDVSAHEREAAEAFDGEAFVPDDGRVVEVPFPDA